MLVQQNLTFWVHKTFYSVNVEVLLGLVFKSSEPSVTFVSLPAALRLFIFSDLNIVTGHVDAEHVHFRIGGIETIKVYVICVE